MGKIIHNVCIVGGGNISNTRHIPALKKTKRTNILGVVGISEKHINRTINNYKLQNSCLFENAEEIKNSKWIEQCDCAVIGTPPKEHFRMAKIFLELGKHVLLEKPFTMNTEEANELIELAKANNKRLAVMHNFQFANDFVKLEKKIKEGKIGEIVSFFEIQYTNRSRRLPEWYNDLPMGLFYDESAHFIYLLEKLGGELKIDNVFVYNNPDKTQNTPVLLNANFRAGNIPSQLFINFNSPVCSWMLVVSGTKMLAVYDMFRDILITIPDDGLHLAKDVLSNSLHFTFKHWLGTFRNGFRMLTGNLLYGQNVVMNLFLDMIDENKDNPDINGYNGLKNIKIINELVESKNER